MFRPRQRLDCACPIRPILYLIFHLFRHDITHLITCAQYPLTLLRPLDTQCFTSNSLSETDQRIHKYTSSTALLTTTIFPAIIEPDGVAKAADHVLGGAD